MREWAKAVQLADLLHTIPVPRRGRMSAPTPVVSLPLAATPSRNRRGRTGCRFAGDWLDLHDDGDPSFSFTSARLFSIHMFATITPILSRRPAPVKAPACLDCGLCQETYAGAGSAGGRAARWPLTPGPSPTRWGEGCRVACRPRVDEGIVPAHVHPLGSTLRVPEAPPVETRLKPTATSARCPH